MIALRDVTALSARVSEKTVWTFVRVEAAGGCIGWGEATLQGSATAVHREVARWAPALVGRGLATPCDVAEIVGTCGRSTAEAAAISALDQAIWDLAAQRSQQALAAALGAPRRETIGLYANINRGTLDRRPAGFAARARAAMTCGFTAIKIAPFDGVTPKSADKAADAGALAAGLERIAAVRAAIGPDVRLLVDCHWRLTEPSASDVLREVEPLRLYWLECPLPEEAENFAALRRLRNRANNAGVRLAGCEMMIGRDGFQPFLDASTYDVIMPDVKYAGGLRELLRIAEAAARQNVACSPHNPSGPIAHAHSLHLSAHLPLFPLLEFQFGESPLFFDFIDGALPDPRSGSSDLPQGPGLGLGLGGAALRERLIDIEDATMSSEVDR
jgi:galactonate dehydratase